MRRDALVGKLARALKVEPIAVGESFDSLVKDFDFMREHDVLPDKTSHWNSDHKRLYQEIEMAVRTDLSLPAGPNRYVPYASIRATEVERALAISREQALKLSQDAKVRRFRARYLKGRLLSDDEAKALLEQLDALPLMLHERIRWGQFYELNDRVFAEGGDDLRYDMHERDDRFVAKNWDLPDDVFIELPLLAVPRVGRIQDRQVAGPTRAKLNARLHKLANDIAAQLDWSKGQATWHVLTGKVPLYVPVHVELLTTIRLGRAHTIIAVKHEAWISIETVERVDRDARKRINMPAQKQLADRRFSQRTLSVYRFVNEREELRGHRPPFPKLMDDWNAKHGHEFKQFTNWRRFWEAFSRVEKELSGNSKQATKNRGKE